MNKINEELYMMSEKGVEKYIKKFLRKRNIKYVQIEGGGIYSASIRANYPIFSSHMDRVGGVNDHLIPLTTKGNKMKRLFPAVLGGDDRAGIDIILNLIDNDNETNFVFTNSEETGLVGSGILIENEEFVQFLQECSFMCVLDRKGKNDLIGTENYYCNKDLVKYIESIGYFKNTRGVLCDADNFREFIPCVNLSVGYYNPHSEEEFLDIKEHLEIYKNVEILNIETGSFDMPEEKPIVVFKNYFNYNRDFTYKYSDKMCDLCYNVEGFDTAEVIEMSGTNICKECIQEFYRRLKRED